MAFIEFFLGIVEFLPECIKLSDRVKTDGFLLVFGVVFTVNN